MSVVVTTNLSFSEWSSVLGDGKMWRPHDRPAHCREIVEIGNESWRFLQCSKGWSDWKPPRRAIRKIDLCTSPGEPETVRIKQSEPSNRPE